MIRLILVVIWVVFFLLISIPIQLIELIIGLFNKKARANSSQFIVSIAFRVINFISGIKIIVKGKENIPKDEAVLYVPNHRGIFDIVITYPLCPSQVGFIAKRETKKVPLLNFWMMLMNCQFLDRKDIRNGLKVINKSAELIQNGTSMCIFPEGTRNKTTEDLQEFRDGSFKIAEKAKCPIVPVSISNTEQVLEAHMPFIKPTTVVVEYCKPINPNDFSRTEKRAMIDLCREEILTAYNANKSLF